MVYVLKIKKKVLFAEWPAQRFALPTADFT
jgi:hypothetical protein